MEIDLEKINNIAGLAGLKTSTVFKILHHQDYNINKRTKDKVNLLLKKYLRNEKKQNTKSNLSHFNKLDYEKKIKNIGVLMSNKTPLDKNIIDGIKTRAKEDNANILLYNEDNTYINEDILKHTHLDGLLFNIIKDDDEISFLDYNIPTVTIDKYINAKNIVGRVFVDNKKASFDATNYLIDNGHTNILYITGSNKENIYMDKLEGFKDALNENNLKFSFENIIFGQCSFDWSYNIAKSIDLKKYSAIFCACSDIAHGIVTYFDEHNISIPNDISLITYHSNNSKNISNSKLTTIKEPSFEIGYKAMDILLNNIKSKYNTGQELIGNVNLLTSLIEKNSVKKLI
ncbi:LacI family DNA-binding transcriptional regulator [Peptostreptococcaceae bacterium AGR-M142]